MYKRIAVSLPASLLKRIERERKETCLNRSELIRKSIETFFGLGSKIDQKLIEKYGPVYDALNKENIEIANEMLDSNTTFPTD